MAFETDGLAKAYASAQQESIRVKSFATSHSAALAAGNVSANLVQQIMLNMKSAGIIWYCHPDGPFAARYRQQPADLALFTKRLPF